MKMDSDLYRSESREISNNYDMMRITIDIDWIDGIKLKKAIINMIDSESCELCGHDKEMR